MGYKTACNSLRSGQLDRMMAKVKDRPVQQSEDRSPECKNSGEAPCYVGITVEKAMDCLRDAMKQDHDYAHS